MIARGWTSRSTNSLARVPPRVVNRHVTDASLVASSSKAPVEGPRIDGLPYLPVNTRCGHETELERDTPHCHAGPTDPSVRTQQENAEMTLPRKLVLVMVGQ